MASIEIDVAGRKYAVACRDGEETHLHAAAALVDQRARDATAALGNLAEGRQLLFAALLLADDVKEARAGTSPPPAPQPDPVLAEAIEQVAIRLEALAARVEERAGLEERPANA
jgi:cell division protein ZapA